MKWTAGAPTFPVPLRHCAIAPLRQIPFQTKKASPFLREAFLVGGETCPRRSHLSNVLMRSPELAPLRTRVHERRRRLPGIKGPVPPPLWIRVVSYSTVMELARPIQERRGRDISTARILHMDGRGCQGGEIRKRSTPARKAALARVTLALALSHKGLTGVGLRPNFAPAEPRFARGAPPT